MQLEKLCPVPTPAAVEEEVASTSAGAAAATAGSSKQLNTEQGQAVDTATAVTQPGGRLQCKLLVRSSLLATVTSLPETMLLKLR